MSFKAVLTHVELSEVSDHRLKLAVDLAVRLGATLIGVGGSEPLYLDSPMLLTGYGDGDLIQTLADIEAKNLVAAETSFRRATAALEPAAIWLKDLDYPVAALEACAAGADLVVASAKHGPRASTAAAAILILRAGLPVLTIPTDLPAIRAKNIIIAWENTSQARHAISDALPLLIAAEQVTVLRVHERSKPDNEDHSVDAVLGRLRRHGVNAVANTVARHGEEASFSITKYAEDNLCDLIVAGAYGHSRLGEWALGGVTQSLIDYSPLPVLFSH